MSEAPTACDICGDRTEPGSVLRYTRSGLGRSSVVTERLGRCWACHRHGCPRCLRVVEERADDHYLDLFCCHDCLDREEPAARHHDRD